MISVSSVEKVCKAATHSRISMKALRILRSQCMLELKQMTKNAIALAKHAGRKTLREEDLRFFYKNTIGNTSLHKNSVEKAMKRYGAERVGNGAAELAGAVLEQRLVAIAFKALEFANHAKRKSIMDKDVKLALGGEYY